VALSSTIRTLRSRDITDAIPFNVGQPSYVSDIWTNTTVAYDVAIGGLPFFYGISNERPYERQTAPYKKQQFDNSKEPGEQTLEGWWIRSQSSFHRGAGITFFDPSAGEEVDYRFSSSQGVDVWTKGQVTLLKGTVQVHTSANELRAVSANDGTNDCVVFTDGNTIKKLVMSNDTPTITTYTLVTGHTNQIFYSLTTDGTRYFAADTTAIHVGNIGGATNDDTTYATGTTRVVINFVKQRLFAGVTNSLYELNPNASPSGSHATMALPTAHYTHPNSAWTWTAITESGPAIYAAGYAGNQSAIYKITLKDDATLNAARVTAELPIGETVQSLFSYLGFIMIGTNKGARVAQIDSTTGDLIYGPLIFETTNGVKGFAANDRFVWCASGSNDKTGLVRIDLGEQISPLRFAYASDLEYDSTAATTGIIFIGTRPVFIADNSAIYVESVSSITSGFIQTGFIRYGTLEPKNFKRVRCRGIYDDGGLLISPVGSDGTVYETAIYNSTIGTPEVNIINPPGSQEFIAMKFTLSRYKDPTDTSSTLDTVGPTFKGYQIRSLPATPRQHLIQLPLYCYDTETDRYNVQVGYDGRSWERVQALEDLESTGDEVIFQDFTTGEQITVVIDSVGFQRATPPSGGFSGFGGNLTVIVREVG
jgi:hypothetical protein